MEKRVDVRFKIGSRKETMPQVWRQKETMPLRMPQTAAARARESPAHVRRYGVLAFLVDLSRNLGLFCAFVSASCNITDALTC